MENKERQILSEIMDLMTSVRSQLELLDAKMAQLQQLVGQGDTDVTPIDLDIDDLLVDPVVEDVPAEDNVKWFANSQLLADWLAEQNVSGATVLVKGSRGTRMEKTIQAL
jgi:DnaJ-domain-containing protein 1